MVHEKKLLVVATLTSPVFHRSSFPSLLPAEEPRKLAVAVPILPSGSLRAPSGDCTKPQKERADRPIAISPILHASFRSISPYNIPFVDRTLPANRSSNIVA
jgi:hypothetical protein